MRSYIPLLSLIAALSGCASQVQLNHKTSFSSADLSLVDNRTPEKKAHRRDSNFSAVSLMADDRFTPKAIDLFQEGLLASGKISRPIALEVDEFRVADYFPVRLGAGGQGFLGQLVFQSLIDKNTDWSFVEQAAAPKGTDSLICIFVGKINGVPVKVVSVEPYKLSAFGVMVANDPDYQRAVAVVTQRAAMEAAIQASK